MTDRADAPLLVGPAALSRGKALAVLARIDTVGQIVALSIALVVIVQAVLSAVWFRDIFPFGDMVDLIFRYFTGAAKDFWIYHDYEHLPLFVMPLYWIDLRLFRAQGDFLITCNLLLATAIGLAPAQAIFRATPERRLLAASVSLTILAMTLWLGNFINLVWTKQVHMFAALFAVMVAVSLASSARPRATSHIAAIATWLVVATFSFGYGIIGFPAVLVVGWLRGWPWRRLAAISLAGLACLALYAALALPLPDDPLRNFFLGLHQSSGKLVYALTFLASPPFNILRHFLPEPVALGCGRGLAAAGLIVFCRRIVRARAQPPSEIESWALALGVFTILAAAETAYARAPMFATIQAADGRYIIGQLPFWTGLLLLAMQACHAGSAPAAPVFGVSLAIVTAGLLASQGRIMPDMRLHNQQRWQSAMAAIDHVADPEANFHDEFFYPSRVPIMIDGLRSRQWSVFAWPQAAWIGRALTSFGTGRTGCSGNLDTILQVGNVAGRRVDGWAADGGGPPRSPWILLVDQAGSVRGLAHRGGARPDVAAALGRPEWQYVGWTGYVPASVAPDQVTAYLLMKDRHPCRLATSQPSTR